LSFRHHTTEAAAAARWLLTGCILQEPEGKLFAENVLQGEWQLVVLQTLCRAQSLLAFVRSA
jgi:hypothetical protein